MRYKLVIFDLDGTIIDNIESIWIRLHEFFEIDEHPKRIETRNKFFSEKITYQDWAERDLELLMKHGADRRTIFKALENAKLMKGAKETLKELKRKDYKIAIISGSLNVLLERMIPAYREIFDHVFINRIYFDDKGKINKVKVTPFDMFHKKTGLLKLCELENIKPEQCAFIGDHVNDIEIAKLAGFSIAFNSKSEELNEVSDVVTEKKDLREVLKYLN